MKIKEIETLENFQIRDLCFGTGSKCSMEKMNSESPRFTDF